ncbi:hypothetical protein ACWT_3366 [Actinoplanes sp. SE50]|uniref:hypothetical protein n=1 Tax=unclassified Actinoplanes TaxID=2626549 RepID=UPI00023ED07B|nr:MULTISPECIES: hypothetical protein [unclassified Actinoplanes]AEV84389.1 hypothetical protein ACPL_3494 [Actinoplanes sp. SE50/110]ATO82781.1 hypothetical protein ACWT_3366 [Actinoplanes sp. SE50]SLM00189.1 hypothetical protein ACSP50_3421 [Actinoplanes sp. SE50/110]
MGGRSWSGSPLAVAQRAFVLLVAPPTPLVLDSGTVAGVVPLDRLRGLLLSSRTGPLQRDAVWRELVLRARADGPGWVVGAVGVAMPGLRRAAGALCAGRSGDSEDLDAELLAGFVAALRRVDVEAPRICGRLIDAGVRAARRARHVPGERSFGMAGVPGPAVPARPADHPDFVLARAVAAGVVDADEAHLIAATRLEGETLSVAGERLGLPARLASAWRAQAEQRLREAIRDGELAHIALRPRRSGDGRPTLTTKAAA